MRNDARKPQARKNDLVVQDQGEETLIYDTKNHHAHCLKPLAALVWRHCDGRRSMGDLAAIAHQHFGVPDDTQIVEVTLQELEQASLLEGPPSTTGTAGVSRRELGRRLGAVAAAFLVAPLVTSIRTQPAMAAVSPPPGTTSAAPTSREPVSDRNLKQDFASVDVHDVLRSLASLPIQKWSYKDSPAVRHIGPMAQDFAAAFHVGQDDRHIHGLDSGGVAFAAIQALHALVQEKDQQIGELRSELDELRQRVLRGELLSCTEAAG